MRLIALILCALTAQAAVNVTSSHPNRLVLDATRLAAVQAKIGTQEWTDYKAFIDTYRTYNSGSFMELTGTAALGQALICRATANTDYCTTAAAQFMAQRSIARNQATYTTVFDIANSVMGKTANIFYDAAPLYAGQYYPVQFWTSGGSTLPTPLAFNTTYFVKYSHRTTSPEYYWTIHATRGGAPIALSGTTTGTIYVEAIWGMTGGPNGTNAPRWWLYYWPILYDQLYSYLTTDQRTDMYEILRACMQHAATFTKSDGRLLSNMWTGTHRMAATSGIAIVGDDPTDTTAVQALLDSIEEDFNAELSANGSLLNGVFSEGTEYMAEQQTGFWEYLDAIYVASGRTDNRFTALQSYWNGVLDYYTYAFQTGTFTYGGKTYHDMIGHGEVIINGVWNLLVDGARVIAPAYTHRRSVVYMQETMQLYGDTTRAAIAKKLLTDYMPYNGLKDSSTYSYQQMYSQEIIFGHPSVTGAYWSTNPFIKRFAGAEEVFFKSSWNSDSTSISVSGAITKTATSIMDHVRSEAGTFQIYRKGTSLTGNLNTYSYDDSNGVQAYQGFPGFGGHASTYNVVTAAGISAWNTYTSQGPTGQPTMDLWETDGSAYGYGRLDMGPVYRNYSGTVPPENYNNTTYIVSSAKREFLYLSPDTFVVHDKISKSQTTPTSQWNLQGYQRTMTTPSANTIKIDTGTQFLNATVISPASPKIVIRRSDRVAVLWVSRSTTPQFTLEADLGVPWSGGGYTSVSSFTLSGATGDWAVLNGTWDCTTIIADTGKSKHFRVNAGQVDTSGIASTFGGQALTVDSYTIGGTTYNLTTAMGTAHALTGMRYGEIAGTETANENFMVVLQSADSGATPPTVTKLASTNLNVAQIGNEVVGFVPQTLALPIVYAHGASGLHRIAGMTPGGTYTVDTSTPGSVTITATGAVTASSAGVLSFYTGAVPLTLAAATLPSGVSGVAYSHQLSATGGGPPYSYAVTAGTICSGLALSSGGLISGNPTTAQTCSFTVTVTDAAAATDDAVFGLTIEAYVVGPVLTILTSDLPGATVGTAYNTSIVADFGVLPYAWSITPGFCAGLALTGSTISGTPAAQGLCSFTVTVTDALNGTAIRALSISVAPSAGDPLVTNEAVSVAVHRAGAGAIVTARLAGLDRAQACQLDVFTAALATVHTSVSTSGTAVRRLTVAGLTPGTVYHFRVVCGANGGTAQSVAAVAALTGTADVLIQRPGAFTVAYGPAFASSAAAVAGVATLPAQLRGVPVQYRLCSDCAVEYVIPQ